MRRLALALCLVFAAGAPGQVIRPNPGFRANSIARNDDGSGPAVPIGFTINFFGRVRTTLWVNNNGNVTLDSPLSTYTPFGLERTQREIIAAFFADVDTRPDRSLLVTYGRDTINNHPAFGANFLNVGYYNVHDDKLNSFQLILIERADTGPGNFDIEFNYERIAWETGDASGGAGGYGGVSASVGWSNGSGEPGTSYELPGSRIPGSFLDNGLFSLVRKRQNSTTVGRMVFRARDGIVIPGLTVSTGCPLPAATFGTPYRQSLQAFGGTPPFRWSLEPDPGVVLPGLSLTTDGVLSGTPNVTGSFDFTLKLIGKGDDGDEVVVKRCNVTVAPQQLAIAGACPLPDATTGVPYSASMQVRGGSAPYSWWVSDGALPAGLALASGAISGMPSKPGTYKFTLNAANSNPDQASPATRECRVTVYPAGLRTTLACPLPNGVTGVPYSAALQAGGGAGPYTWSLTGALPAGLSLVSDGRIVGTPLVAAAFPFTLGVKDSRGQAMAQPCSITVTAPEVNIANACPLPAATTGSPYSTTLAATGGSGPYTWWVAGTLPPDLSISPGGVIAGVPLNAGASQFRLVVLDSEGRPAGKPCSLTVNRGTVAVTACPLPEARVSQSYSRILTAAGGWEPYMWSVAGRLPDGMSFSPEGALTGRPAVAGDFPLTLRLLDARGATASQSCSLAVQPPAPRISTACPLPAATLGAEYSADLNVTDGAPPYSWSIAGALPAGLSLGDDNRITGTPQALGDFPFQLRVTDSRGQSDGRACAISASLPDLPAVRIAAPAETLAPASPASVVIELSQPYSLAISGFVTVNATADTAGLDAATNRADPRLRFTGGQTSARFSIPAGSRSATIALLSTGTVAVTAEFRITELRAGGVNVRVTTPARFSRVPRSAPVVTDACFSPSSSGVDVVVSGYSSTRELRKAAVQLSGGNTLSPDIAGVASDWFASDDSVRFGGAFTLRVPVALQGGSAGVSSVSVTLTNAAGTSPARSGGRCP